METTKVCNTEDMIVLCKTAKENDFNRQVTQSFIDNLDSDGKHLVIMEIGFMGNGDVHRCKVFAKFEGREDPTIAYLDVRAEDFDRLVGARQYMAQAN